jgi:hypothetical protein
MNSYSINTTATEKVSLDLKIASLFYASDVAFNALQFNKLIVVVLLTLAGI